MDALKRLTHLANMQFLPIHYSRSDSIFSQSELAEVLKNGINPDLADKISNHPHIPGSLAESITNKDWSNEELYTLLKMGERAHGLKQGAYLRYDGELHRYMHMLKDSSDETLESIYMNGIRANAAIGLLSKCEGVYAHACEPEFYSDDDCLEKIFEPHACYARNRFVAFRTRHPCTIGDRCSKNTAFFYLLEGKYVQIQDVRFYELGKDLKFKEIIPEFLSQQGSDQNPAHYSE